MFDKCSKNEKIEYLKFVLRRKGKGFSVNTDIVPESTIDEYLLYEIEEDILKHSIVTRNTFSPQLESPQFNTPIFDLERMSDADYTPQPMIKLEVLKSRNTRKIPPVEWNDTTRIEKESGSDDKK